MVQFQSTEAILIPFHQSTQVALYHKYSIKIHESG